LQLKAPQQPYPRVTAANRVRRYAVINALRSATLALRRKRI
jgi:hypothetical protein